MVQNEQTDFLDATCVPQQSECRYSTCSASFLSSGPLVFEWKQDSPPTAFLKPLPGRAPKHCKFLTTALLYTDDSFSHWFGELTVKCRHGDVCRGGGRWEWPPSIGSICYLAAEVVEWGMSRFGKEVRGLLFPLIARCDIEEMTKDW